MIKFKKKLSKAEAAGYCITNETRFSPVGLKNEQVISPVSCRTFLAEVVWAFLGKGTIPRTDYKNEPLNTDVTKMTIGFKTNKEKTIFIERLPDLNALEEKYGLTKTTYDETQEDLTFLLTGDIKWQGVLAITLYSFLLKRITYKADSDMDNYEEDFAKTFIKNEEGLFNMVNTTKEEKYLKTSFAVHCDGFIELSTQKDHQNKHLLKA